MHKDTVSKIMDSDEFVLSEVQKLKVLYGLKKEIRYGYERIYEHHTESVAEHIYALHCLIDYFLPLEDTEGKWDKLKIHQMAQYHDIDEIETGDIVGYKKTQQEKDYERKAAEIVISNLPETLKVLSRELLDEFDALQSTEARFVKALDKFEPIFEMYSEAGKKWLHENKITREVHNNFKYPYVKGFPIIYRFEQVMADIYEKEGFYYSES